MAEPNLVTSELNIFFDEWGHIGMGGGLHIKLIVPGTPTTKTIQGLVDRVHEWGNEQEPEEPQEAADVPLKAKMDSSVGEIPRCPKKGVWAAAKGNYPEGYKKDWRHNEPRMNKKGELYCPTPVAKDKNGELLWCPWRARQVEGDEWEEYEVGATFD